MSIEEKSTPSRVRFRLLDLAIGLLVVLCILALWQRNNLIYVFETDRTQRAFAVSFEVDRVRYEAVEALAANTVLYLPQEENAVELGTLREAPSLLPEVEISQGDNGPVAAIRPSLDPARYVNLYGTFTCRGVLRDGRLVVGHTTLGVGDELAVVAADSTLTIRIVALAQNP